MPQIPNMHEIPLVLSNETQNWSISNSRESSSDAMAAFCTFPGNLPVIEFHVTIYIRLQAKIWII